MFSVATARFNKYTLEENRTWRARNAHKGAVYGVMKPITTTTIPLESYVFVLEMNNETNTIVGVGFIQNMPDPKENVPIYTNRNYCCYTYYSPYRVDRSEITGRGEHVLKILELLVFKGATHMKRAQGITVIPATILERGRLDFVSELAGLLCKKYSELVFGSQRVTLRSRGSEERT